MDKMGFEKEFSDDGFWDKAVNYAKSAGFEVIEKALWLYYAAQDADTPVWAKTAIYGALGYFISPVDAIPDLVPVVGYSDDLGVLAAAVAMTVSCITSDVKKKTNEKMIDWFGG